MDRDTLLATLGDLLRQPDAPRLALTLDLAGLLHIDEPVFRKALTAALAADRTSHAMRQFELPHHLLVMVGGDEAMAERRQTVAAVGRVLSQHGRGQIHARLFDLAAGTGPLAAHLRERAQMQGSPDRVEHLEKPTELARFMAIERSLHGVDLSALLRQYPIWRAAPEEGGEPQAMAIEYTVALPDVERLFDVQILDNPMLMAQVTELLDRRMLYHLLRDRDQHPVPIAVKLHATTVIGDEFARIASELPVRWRGNLIIELPWLEWKLVPALVTNAAAILRRQGLLSALDHVSPAALAADALPAVDFFRVPHSDGSDAPFAADQATAGLQKHGADRCILSRCHTAEAVEQGRAAGFLLFEGAAAHAALLSGGGADNAPAAAVQRAAEEEAAAASAATGSATGWLSRLFRRRSRKTGSAGEAEKQRG